MKGIVLMMLMIIVSGLAAQTIESEKEIVNYRLKQGGLSDSKIKKIAKEWKSLTNDGRGYPEIPYNIESGLVEYEFIEKVPTAKKESILVGVKEWMAIKDVAIGNELAFEDFRSGRMIIKAWYSSSNHLPNNRGFLEDLQSSAKDVECSFDMVFTAKQGIYKLEIMNIKYLREINTYRQLSDIVDTDIIERKLESLLPITSRDEKHWETCKNLIQETDDKLNAFQLSLQKYLIERKDSFDF